MLEKLTISEMACYPEGTAKRQKALTLRPTTGTSYSCSLMVWGCDCSLALYTSILTRTAKPHAKTYILLHTPLTYAFSLQRAFRQHPINKSQLQVMNILSKNHIAQNKHLFLKFSIVCNSAFFPGHETPRWRLESVVLSLNSIVLIL